MYGSVPERHQGEIFVALSACSGPRVDLVRHRNSLARSDAPQDVFTADIWARLQIRPTGFADFEVHVGEQGPDHPKSVMKSQFWVRLRQRKDA